MVLAAVVIVVNLIWTVYVESVYQKTRCYVVTDLCTVMKHNSWNLSNNYVQLICHRSTRKNDARCRNILILVLYGNKSFEVYYKCLISLSLRMGSDLLWWMLRIYMACISTNTKHLCIIDAIHFKSLVVFKYVYNNCTYQLKI
jgi:hypothetical protein